MILCVHGLYTFVESFLGLEPQRRVGYAIFSMNCSLSGWRSRNISYLDVSWLALFQEYNQNPKEEPRRI